MNTDLRIAARCLLLTLLAAPLFAQGIPRPTGLFCSCPPTNAVSSSFLATVAAKPFVDGFLVRIAWSDVETSPSVFDWTLLDGQLQLCQQAGKKVALAIVQGPGTPAWLSGLGAATLTYSFSGRSQTIAVPWDPIYLQRWQQFVAALGARYAADTTIALVHVTHATHNGFEMQLAPAEQQTYVGAGYTDAVYAQSWDTVISAFAAAFPNHPLDMDLHPIFGSDAVAGATVTSGLAAAPGRFGAFGGWWSVNNAQNAYPGMQALFEATAATSFTNVQNVGSWVTTPTRYGSSLATYEAAYDLALQSGIRYLEVWNADLLDPGLDPLLTQVAGQLRCAGWYQRYPSAATPPAAVHGITGCTAPAMQFDLTVAGGPANSLALFAVGTDRGVTTVPGIGDVQIAPFTQLITLGIVVLDGNGAGALTVTAPASAPYRFTTQAAVLGSSGVTLTNAMELR